MLHTQPLSYAQRAKNAQVKSKDESPVLDNPTRPPTSPTLAVKALNIVASQKDTTIVNVWSQRKEKMAAAAAATHQQQQQQQNTFPSRDNTLNGVDTSSWPEVGKGFETPGDTTDEQEREKENVSHTPRKTKWVPIPPEELQAAADALRVKSSKSSRSNSRNNNKRNATAANPNTNGSSTQNSQSGRQSTPASTSHSRVNSRSASVHSSPHLFAHGRRLPDDQDHSVPMLNGTNTNANGGMKPLSKDDAYRPYQPQPYLPSPITITRNNTNTSTGSPTYPYPIYPAYGGSGPGPVFEYPSAGSSTMPTPQHSIQHHHHSTMPTPQTMPVPQPYWLHHNPSSHAGSGQSSPLYPPPQGMYSIPQPVHHHHGSGRKPPEHAAPVVVAGFSYGHDVTTGNGKKARRGGGPVLFGSIASAQEVTPSPSPGPSMPMPVLVNGVSGGGVGGLAIDELGVRRITTRHGGEQGGVLNGAGVGKWEFGTTGLTLDDQPDLGDADVNVKLEDSPTLNIPLKTNTNGFAAGEGSKPASGSVSPLVGLGGGLDAFSVKDFGFGFGSRRANVTVGGVNEDDEGGEGVKEEERLVKAKMAELDLGSQEVGGAERPVDVSRTEVEDPLVVAQDDVTHSGGGRPRRGSYAGGGGYTHLDRGGRRGGGRGGTYRGGAGTYPRGVYNSSSSRGSRAGAVYSHHHHHQQQHQHHPQAPFSLSPPPHFQPIEPLSVLAPNAAYFPPPRYLPPGFEAPQAYQGFPPQAAHGQVQVLQPQLQQGVVPPPMPVPLSTLSFPLDPTRYYLLGQLEYYLSPQNMAQDFFLRQRMDSKGWIPIQLLASFNRVRQLTLDITLVRDVLLLSSVAQVHHGGDWVRMGGWESFVLPDAKRSGVDDLDAVAVGNQHDEGVDQVGGFTEEFVVGESSAVTTTLAAAQGESERGERALADGEPARREGSSRRSAGGGGGVRDSPTDVMGGEALEVSERNGEGGYLGHEEVEEEVKEEEEEEEEEDVVFVMGEQVQAVAETWSPERIAA